MGMTSLSELNDVRLSQRANDIKDIGKRVLRHLDPSSIKVSNYELNEPSILARSMGIASIAGAGEQVLVVSSSKVIADGDSGILVVNPTTNDLELAQKLQDQA